jgi:CO/xanthine dehydrogenase Mo-binding subunit
MSHAEICGDTGAYHVFPTTAALEPLGVAQILPGPYLVRHYTYETRAVCTNKAPTGAYRGAGMTPAAFVMESLIGNRIAPANFHRVDAEGAREPISQYPRVAAGGFRQ